MQHHHSVKDIGHIFVHIFTVWESTTIFLLLKEFNLQGNEAYDV